MTATPCRPSLVLAGRRGGGRGGRGRKERGREDGGGRSRGSQKLSPTKSVAVLFIKGKLADINFPGKFLLNREEIEYSHEAWYLGGSSTSGHTST